MKLKCILTILLFAQVCNASVAGFEDHITQHYHPLVESIEQCGIRGPLAGEIAQYALIRQVHEDGLDRKSDYSVPGISVRGWNSQIFNTTLKRTKRLLTVGRCVDAEGMTLLTLQGEGANVVAATTIAFLFDYYPYKFDSFTMEQKHIWSKSVLLSYLLECNPTLDDYRVEFEAMRPEREKILKKCNRMYGYGSERIEGTVKKFQHLFTQKGDGYGGAAVDTGGRIQPTR